MLVAWVKCIDLVFPRSCQHQAWLVHRTAPICFSFGARYKTHDVKLIHNCASCGQPIPRLRGQHSPGATKGATGCGSMLSAKRHSRHRRDAVPPLHDTILQLCHPLCCVLRWSRHPGVFFHTDSVQYLKWVFSVIGCLPCWGCRHAVRTSP